MPGGDFVAVWALRELCPNKSYQQAHVCINIYMYILIYIVLVTTILENR